jgi:hypothetical protein
MVSDVVSVGGLNRNRFDTMVHSIAMACICHLINGRNLLFALENAVQLIMVRMKVACNCITPNRGFKLSNESEKLQRE